MEHGKFKDRYRAGRHVKSVIPWLMTEKGFTCKDAVIWLIDELKRCEEPNEWIMKQYHTPPELAALMVYISHELTDWLFSIADCLGRRYKLHEKCDCFHRWSRDAGKYDIHRLKDIVCYLKKQGCLHEEDLEYLRARLLKVCKQHAK